MSMQDKPQNLSRREVITLGAALAGGITGSVIAGRGSVASGAPILRTSNAAATNTTPPPSVVHNIQQIINAKGTVDNGVLNIEIDRNDINNVRWRGSVPFLPSFEINGTLFFESLGGSYVMTNSDLALKSSEVDPFIDQLIRHNIEFQAEHQHFYDIEPDIWFIHFRARGTATYVAEGIKAALNVTSTPLPQAPPSNPTTPLPAEELGDIIGAKPSIGSNGVVNFDVPRREDIVLGNVHINPYLNVATSISFQPYGGGRNAVAVPDYGMIPSEINRVVGHMRSLGWDSGCLYNQETDEQPQLFFDHMVKIGDSLQLAREIRSGLNLMNVVFMTP
ncbi:MAG: DUF1259 domain-containing protein [Candidatus Eremiobacteraeota bacterium]|nr:DUF1259 domain-containing protein [Candidatus Eremiobacteraeota bacterium]